MSSSVSQARREKLQRIQQREELKSLLVSKFKSKYSAPSVASEVINNEVNRFVNTQKLTEQNLKDLDHRIQAQAKPAPPPDAISVRSLASSKPRSVARVASAPRVAPSKTASSVAGSEPIDEDDEWTQLTKFNQLLHYEEAKRVMNQEKERKKAIQRDLDR